MRRFSIFLLVSLAAMATYACGSATPAGDTPNGNASTAEGDTCPLVDAGPPAECPEGCVWNGNECRKNSSIVMPDSHQKDAGPK